MILPNDLFGIFTIKNRIFNTLSPVCINCINNHSFSLDNGGKKCTFRLNNNKINHAFSDLLNNDDSKIQFTQIILSHIRTLSLEINKETVDEKLVDQLSQNVLKQKETMLS